MNRARMRVALTLGVLLSLPVLGEAAPRRLVAIDLHGEGTGRWISIRTDRPPNFTSFKLGHPARVVVDFAETSAAPSRQAGPPEGPIAGWSVQPIGVEPQVVARVTVELRKDADYTLTSAGNDVELRLVSATSRPLVALESEPRSPAAVPAEPAVESPEATVAKAPPALVEQAKTPPPAPPQAPPVEADAPPATLVEAEPLHAAPPEEEKARAEEEARLAALEEKRREAFEAQRRVEEEARQKREAALAEKEARRRQLEEDKRQRLAATEAAVREKRERLAALEQQRRDKVAAEKRARDEAILAKRQKEQERREQAAAAKRAREEAIQAKRQKELEERRRRMADAQAARERAAEERRRQAAASEARLAAAREAQSNDSHPHAQEKPASFEQMAFRKVSSDAEIVLRTSVPVAYSMREEGPSLRILTLEKTRIFVARNKLALDTSYFGTPVAKVIPHDNPRESRVEVEFDLSTPVPLEIKADGGVLTVLFRAPPVVRAEADRVPGMTAEP